MNPPNDEEENNDEEEDEENNNGEMGEKEEELIIPSTHSQSESTGTGRQSDEATSASRFKGVMLDKTGRYWAAQIHARNLSLFLGHFKSDIQAARAHDSASTKFYGANFDRNFLLTRVTIYEPQFQIMFTEDTVLKMLNDGVYETKFIEFVSNLLSIPNVWIRMPGHTDVLDNVCLREMFHKILSRSDVHVGSILTLPREPAMQHFPQLKPESIEVPLEFADVNRVRTWVFQYGYSKSCQSYVFTTGWSEFVKAMNLRAEDSVVFYRCTELKNSVRKHFYMIDMNMGFRRKRQDVAEEPVEVGGDIDRPSGSGEEGDSKELKRMKLFGSWIR